ncbi:hypothetical protein BpHYR1_035938 [Brachionus plicatilis]|uniref:Uncharacterized protein n=1 Tax=Brachionus plicatilis TaxID=10195 RepID=A0A3M7QSH5_BRAPC|nr:hypothetical protein BpHYR1_035938 [Brachionus plicatilis]
MSFTIGSLRNDFLIAYSSIEDFVEVVVDVVVVVVGKNIGVFVIASRLMQTNHVYFRTRWNFELGRDNLRTGLGFSEFGLAQTNIYHIVTVKFQLVHIKMRINSGRCYRIWQRSVVAKAFDGKPSESKKSLLVV